MYIVLTKFNITIEILYIKLQRPKLANVLVYIKI